MSAQRPTECKIEIIIIISSLWPDNFSGAKKKKGLFKSHRLYYLSLCSQMLRLTNTRQLNLNICANIIIQYVEFWCRLYRGSIGRMLLPTWQRFLISEYVLVTVQYVQVLPLSSIGPFNIVDRSTYVRRKKDEGIWGRRLSRGEWRMEMLCKESSRSHSSYIPMRNYIHMTTLTPFRAVYLFLPSSRKEWRIIDPWSKWMS